MSKLTQKIYKTLLNIKRSNLDQFLELSKKNILLFLTSTYAEIYYFNIKHVVKKQLLINIFIVKLFSFKINSIHINILVYYFSYYILVISMHLVNNNLNLINSNFLI